MWDTIAVENHNGIVRHYLVSVLEVDTGEIDVYTAVATQLNISRLHPYYTYICVVAAVTIRTGPFSHNISIITPQGGNCMGMQYIKLASYVYIAKDRRNNQKLNFALLRDTFISL